MALSLMPYLEAEEAHGDHQATEAVILTYNVDLAFFEARALGLLQASGALVTLIADGNVWSPDPRAIHHAGRSYHVGLATTRGAFHPKVTIVAGPERAIAAVGSGNLTLGGWQYNAELLTVFTANRNGVPDVFTDLRDLLFTLVATNTNPDSGMFLDPVAVRGLDRTTRVLNDLISTGPPVSTGYRVVSSVDGPLINNLPTSRSAEEIAGGVVDQTSAGQVLLTAPFHDPNAAAIAEILKRLNPVSTKVAVQPGWTSLNKSALTTALDTWAHQSGGTYEIVLDEESAAQGGRYRHGKLIEWDDGEGNWAALTGSPNLSVAALMRSTSSGGNHEVAVLGPAPRSLRLFPNGTPTTMDALPDLAILLPEPGQEPPSPGPVLAAAIRTPGKPGTGHGIRFHLARPVTDDISAGRIEISRRRNDPDDWQPYATIPANATTFETGPSEDPADELGPGSRFRTTWTGADGIRHVGRLVFLTDPDKVTRRITERRVTSHSQNTSDSDLLGDELAYLDAAMKDLTAFATDAHTFTTNRAKPLPPAPTDQEESPTNQGLDDQHIEPWLWAHEATVNLLGSALAGFALGLPGIPGASPTDSHSVPWLDRLTPDNDAALADDTADTVDADPTVPDTDPTADGIDAGPDHTDDNDSVRRQRRLWCTRATNLVAASTSVVLSDETEVGTHPLTLASRLFVLRTTLVFWSAGNWQSHDPAPLHLIARLVRSFADDAVQGTGQQQIGQSGHPVAPEMTERVGSLTAVAVAVVRSRVNATVDDEMTLAYRALLADAEPLLGAASPDLIVEYSRFLRNDSGYPLDPGAVQDTLAVLTHITPTLADAIQAIEQRGCTVRLIGDDLLLITHDRGNPEQLALEAVAYAQDVRVGAWATTPRGWALVLWETPDLVTITGGAKPTRWRHQALTSTYSPAAVNTARRMSETPLYVQAATPRHAPTKRARALLDSFQIEDPDPDSELNKTIIGI